MQRVNGVRRLPSDHAIGCLGAPLNLSEVCIVNAGIMARTTNMCRALDAPSVLLPEIVIPSAARISRVGSLQSFVTSTAVLWPESFRGGCSFGTGIIRFSPVGEMKLIWRTAIGQPLL